MEDKLILKNFRPTFISPVVAMINTDNLVDDTNKQGAIPPSEYRMEEKLRREHQVLKEKLKKEQITADKYHKQADEIHQQIALFQRKLEENLAKETQGDVNEIIAKDKFSFFGKKYTKKAG